MSDPTERERMKTEAEASEHESRANRWMVQAQHAEAELAAAIKQALEQHRIVQDLGRELRAERERAEKMTSECQLWMDTCRNAEERAERLEQALRSIATNTCCDSCQEAALVAREALRHDAPWPCGHAKLHHEDELCRECSP